MIAGEHGSYMRCHLQMKGILRDFYHCECVGSIDRIYIIECVGSDEMKFTYVGASNIVDGHLFHLLTTLYNCCGQKKNDDYSFIDIHKVRLHKCKKWENDTSRCVASAKAVI